MKDALQKAFSDLDYEDKTAIDEIQIVMTVLEQTKAAWEALTDADYEKIVWGKELTVLTSQENDE
jgi:hypothetical protein